MKKLILFLSLSMVGCATSIHKEYDSQRRLAEIQRTELIADAVSFWDSKLITNDDPVTKKLEKMQPDLFMKYSAKAMTLERACELHNEWVNESRADRIDQVNAFFDNRKIQIERERSQALYNYWDSVGTSSRNFSNSLNQINTQNQLNRIERNQSRQNDQLQQIKASQPPPTGIQVQNR